MGGPYDEWLREHTFQATVRVELWYDGKALHYRRILEGLELRNKLGVERLVGEELVINTTGSELRDVAVALRLSETEVERLTSGETVEVYLGTSSETCTDGPDPGTTTRPTATPGTAGPAMGPARLGSTTAWPTR